MNWMVDILSGVPKFLASVALFGAWGTVTFFVWKNWIDNSKERKRTALEILHRWVDDCQTREMLAAVRLGQKMERPQCNQVLDWQSARITNNPENMRDAQICLASVLGSRRLATTLGDILIQVPEIDHLRWLIRRRIEHTETALLAWTLNTADRRTLEDQFRFLVIDRVTSQPVDNTLKKFRGLMGGEPAFPATYKFVQKLERQISAH